MRLDDVPKMAAITDPFPEIALHRVKLQCVSDASESSVKERTAPFPYSRWIASNVELEKLMDAEEKMLMSGVFFVVVLDAPTILIKVNLSVPFDAEPNLMRECPSVRDV